jgi:hypothetical protein
MTCIWLYYEGRCVCTSKPLVCHPDNVCSTCMKHSAVHELLDKLFDPILTVQILAVWSSFDATYPLIEHQLCTGSPREIFTMLGPGAGMVPAIACSSSSDTFVVSIPHTVHLEYCL